MTRRTTIELGDDTHRFLMGYAHEQSMKLGRRVSLNSVISAICDEAVDQIKAGQAAATAASAAHQGEDGAA